MGEASQRNSWIKFECSMRNRLNNKVIVIGSSDIVTSNALWEIKCVKAIKSWHKLQLAVYAWMRLRLSKRFMQAPHTSSDASHVLANNETCSSLLRLSTSTSNRTSFSPNPTIFRLYNVLTDEMWELDLSTEKSKRDLQKVIRVLASTYLSKNAKTIPNLFFLELVKKKFQSRLLPHIVKVLRKSKKKQRKITRKKTKKRKQKNVGKKTGNIKRMNILIEEDDMLDDD